MKQSELVELWLASVKAAGKAESTQKKYRSVLVYFGDAIETKTGVAFVDTTNNLWEVRGFSNNYMSVLLNIVKIFLTFATKNDPDHSNRPIWKDINELIEAPPSETKIMHTPSTDDVEAVLRAATFVGGHNNTVGYLLMADLGLRSAETTSLTWDDIDFDKPSVLIRNTKSHKDRMLPLGHSERLMQAILLRREWWEENVLPNILANPPYCVLANNTTGRMLNQNSLWDGLKRYSKASGLKTNITPHSLRRYFATRMVENGVDIFTIQKTLGHAQISTTWVYIQTASIPIESMANRLRVGLTPKNDLHS